MTFGTRQCREVERPAPSPSQRSLTDGLQKQNGPRQELTRAVRAMQGGGNQNGISSSMSSKPVDDFGAGAGAWRGAAGRAAGALRSGAALRSRGA